MQSTTSLDRFRSAVMTDHALQARLLELQSDTAFAAAAEYEARALGLELEARHIVQTIDTRTTESPAGPAGLLKLSRAPPKPWIPFALSLQGDALALEWIAIAPDGLQHPFFSQSLAAALQSPFGRFMQCETPIDALDEFAEASSPSGLVLHMSRCGSTLVSQMLASVQEFTSISEAPVLDAMLQLAIHGMAQDRDVRNLVAALARNRTGATTHRFVKLDCWHIHALPHLRRIFPGVPWVFLYRDALEVLVSHRRNPGMHVIPGYMSLECFGIRNTGRIADEDYPAWILAQYCEAALSAIDDPYGLFVDYRNLPDAVSNSILPHFGCSPNTRQRAQMDAASRRNAKLPNALFVPDSALKKHEALHYPETPSQARLISAIEAIAGTSATG